MGAWVAAGTPAAEWPADVFRPATLPLRLPKHPCFCDGDANLDGVFDDDDFWKVLNCFGEPPFDECYFADINCDGLINQLDIDPADPFAGDSSLVCLRQGMPQNICCPGHVPCGLATSGNCFVAHESASCDDPVCCITVCMSDPFCCDFFWDPFCVQAAAVVCLRLGDCDEDDDVDLDDYPVLTQCSSVDPPLPSECACVDFDRDGDTDLLDFRAFQLAVSAP